MRINPGSPMAMVRGSRYSVTTMLHWSRRLFSLILLLILPGCSTVQEFFSNGSSSAAAGHMNQSTIDRLAPAVRKDFEQLTRPQPRSLLTAHETIETIPAQFKRRLAVKALKQPWDGLTDLERQGLLLADIAEGGALNLPAVLDVLEAGMDRTSTFYKPVPLPASSSREHLLAFMAGSLEQASLHRDRALTNLTDTERHFLFLHEESMMEHFTPQISNLSDRTSRSEEH